MSVLSQVLRYFTRKVWSYPYWFTTTTKEQFNALKNEVHKKKVNIDRTIEASASKSTDTSTCDNWAACLSKKDKLYYHVVKLNKAKFGRPE